MNDEFTKQALKRNQAAEHDMEDRDVAQYG